jgi:hypothetical protein
MPLAESPKPSCRVLAAEEGGIDGMDHSLGSTGSDSSARTAKTHSWTR